MTQIGDVIYTNAHNGDVIAASSLSTRQVSQVAQLSMGQLMNGMTAVGPVAYTVVADSIVALDTSDPEPQVTTLPVSAPLTNPDGLCSDGTSIYVCMGDATVRQLNPETAELSLVAGKPGVAGLRDGLGADAGFVDPASCAWDPVRRALYVSDRNGQAIRKIQ
jgi:hypothetical protein